MLTALAATLPADPDPSFVWGLYKDGHLIPAIIVASFFVLRFAETKFNWLRVGYRKVLVSALLAALGMLAERAASGTTPNIAMFAGAVGAAFMMWMKTQGTPAPAKVEG